MRAHCRFWAWLLVACAGCAARGESAARFAATPVAPSEPAVEVETSEARVSEGPSFGAPLAFRETERRVRLTPLATGVDRALLSPDGVTSLVFRAQGGPLLLPGKRVVPTLGAHAASFSADGARLLVRGEATFDVYALPALKRVVHLEGFAAAWSKGTTGPMGLTGPTGLTGLTGPMGLTGHEIAYLDGSGRLAWADADDRSRGRRGASVGCETGPLCGGPEARPCAGVSCESLVVAFASEREALLKSAGGPEGSQLHQVDARAARDLVAESEIVHRLIVESSVGPTGVVCVLRNGPEALASPGLALLRPTEVACARAPWDTWNVVLRPALALSAIEVIDERRLLVSSAEPGAAPLSLRHCLVDLDTLVARCTDDERFGRPWRPLADGRTVIQESLPPRWPRPLVLDLDAGTYAAFGKVAEYQPVAPCPGHPERFAIGLDESGGEGDRAVLVGVLP